MSLKDWERSGWIENHRPSRREIAEIFSAVSRDLKTSAQPGLDMDWKFAIAYNAALQSANAALAASGYRARREAHHYRVIQSLAFTIEAEPELIELLDRFRKKRNLGTYERAGAISKKEAAEMRNLALLLRDRISAWIKTHHPDLFG